MEKKLRGLFDYQSFSGNKKLAALISETERRYSRELSDDDISIVSAAGDPFPDTMQDKDKYDG